MSTLTSTQPMTAEEFADWVQRPENANRWFELVRGEVIELPAPTRPHGVVCSNVAWILGSYVRQRQYGYVASNDSGVILEREPDTVRGPDVALYEDAATFEELHPKYGEVPPLLAVEVLSPSDRANRILRKITDYLTHGVQLVWLIDPEDHTVTVHAPNKPHVLLEKDAELTGDPVLPGFRCRVADLFAIPGGRPANPLGSGSPPANPPAAS
jgi:Uma2 family endonuclease